MYKNHISLSGIISRLLKNPMLEDLSEDDALESALDCISLIGTISMFKDATLFIDIEDNRGAIPYDVVTMDSVRYVVNGVIDSESRDRLPMRPASNPYHLGIPNQDGFNQDSISDLTYSTNGNFIYTSFLSGRVEVNYKTLLTTETGELLIPDDINVIKALENYIKQEFYQPLWEMGKIQDKVMNKVEQDYDWYVAKARTSTRELNLDERESLSNMLTSFVTNNDHNGDFYQNLGQQEFRVRN